MSHISTRSRSRAVRIAAGIAALAVPAAILAATAPAHAFTPAGAGGEMFLATGGATGDPANEIKSGFWGHEGTTHDGTTYYDLNIAGTPGGTVNSTTTAAALAAIGPDATLADLHVAFVTPSTGNTIDNPKPTVTAGETVGQAFHWFNASTFGGAENGNSNTNDYVDALSTESQYNAWFSAGQKPYGFDDSLVAHDTTSPGDPVSAAPIGTSILNTWPSGTIVDVVYYVSTSNNANNEPVVTVGPGGKAETAWMQIKTVGLTSHTQDPTTGLPDSYDTVRTSAGYVDMTAGTQTTTSDVTATPPSPQSADSAVSFSATVKTAGSSPVAVTVGSVDFKDGSTDLGTAPVDSSGTATVNLAGGALAAGTHTITAYYLGTTTSPIYSASDDSASATPLTYDATASSTTTVLTVSPQGTQAPDGNPYAGSDINLTAVETKTANGSPVAGTVTFKGYLNGSTSAITLGTASTGTGSSAGIATLDTTNLTQGTWKIEADFAPTDTTSLQPSSNSQSGLVVDPPANLTYYGNVTADIPTGSLQITTPYTNQFPINVGTLAQDADPTQGYNGSTTFSGIAITDDRAGDQPWTLTGLSSALQGPDSSHPINAEDVGITNMSTSVAPTGAAITYTDAPAASPAVEAVDPLHGTAGLVSTETLAHTAKGVGTWMLGGTLTVNAPADTPAGHYVGTVTFTVLNN